MRLPRSPRWWLFGGAGGVLLAAVAVTVVVVHSGSAACAAVPAQAPAAQKATFYAATGAGNCSFEAVPSPLVVALGPSEYRAGASCGGYLDVKGPKGSVRVKVVDQCPECPAGHIDLSREAFAKIGNPVDGIIPVTYSTVGNPGVPGPVTVRVKEGSSAYWLALRFDNHGNALTSAELQVGGGFQKLERTDYNYWIAQSGAGSGPFTVRLTDTAGHRSTVPGVRLAPESVQRSGVSMYSGGAAPAQAAGPAPARSTSAAASPPASTAPNTTSPSASAPEPVGPESAQALPVAEPVRTGCG